MRWWGRFKRRFIYGPAGHSIMCRFVAWVIPRFGGSISRHDGPGGSQFCFYAMNCKAPTKAYLDVHNERAKAFHAFTKLLVDEGVIVSHVWENPRFSVERLCDCGNDHEKSVKEHDPLCNYRERWGAHPTREEFAAERQKGKAAPGQVAH